MRRRTLRGFLMGAALFLLTLAALTLIVPAELAWLATLTALGVAISVGRAAANPETRQPPVPPNGGADTGGHTLGR